MQKKPQRQIEIFGNIRFRPLFPFIIRCINESRILYRRPTKESIVSNEGSNFAISTAKRDTFVDTTSKVCDTVFEIMVGNLHNV